MTTTEYKTVEFEIVPSADGLEPTAKRSLELAFSGFFSEAAKWKSQAETITDPKLARTARLEIKNLRVAAEKKRKELKEDSLRMGKAIDGANNILLAMIVPIEKSLEDIEKQEERRLAAELAELVRIRTEMLLPFIDPSMPLPNVGAMTQEQFDAALDDAKLLTEMKAEAARKAEAERLEREAAEARERVRIAAENDRLKQEAEAREKVMESERKAAAAKQTELEEAARKERERVESESKAAAEKARKEREEIEAKAKAEREAAAETSRKERLARENAEAEAKALRDAEDARKAAEEKSRQDAALAPDREKMAIFAATIRALEVPSITSKKGQAIIAEWIEEFATKIEDASSRLRAK